MDLKTRGASIVRFGFSKTMKLAPSIIVPGFRSLSEWRCGNLRKKEADATHAAEYFSCFCAMHATKFPNLSSVSAFTAPANKMKNNNIFVVFRNNKGSGHEICSGNYVPVTKLMEAGGEMTEASRPFTIGTSSERRRPQRKKKITGRERYELEFWAGLDTLNEAGDKDLAEIDVVDPIVKPLVGTTVINAFAVPKPKEPKDVEEVGPVEEAKGLLRPEEPGKEEDLRPVDEEKDDELTVSPFPKNKSDVPEVIVSLFREFPLTDVAFGSPILDIDALWEPPFDDRYANETIRKGLAECDAAQHDVADLVKEADKLDGPLIPEEIDENNPDHDYFTKLGMRFVSEMQEDGSFPTEADQEKWKKFVDQRVKEHDAKVSPADVQKDLDELQKLASQQKQQRSSQKPVFPEDEAAALNFDSLGNVQETKDDDDDFAQERDDFYGEKAEDIVRLFGQLDNMRDTHPHITDKIFKDQPSFETSYDLDAFEGVPESKDDCS